MSKMRYVSPDHEPQDDNAKKSWFQDRSFWITLLVTTLVLIATGALIVSIEYFSQKDHPDDRFVLHLLTDAFGVSGILGVGIFCLTWAASAGAFDMLVYGVKLVFYTTFMPRERSEKLPKTFYDYKVLKDREKRKPVYGILFPSILFLIVGLILLIFYNI